MEHQGDEFEKFIYEENKSIQDRNTNNDKEERPTIDEEVNKENDTNTKENYCGRTK